MYLATGSALLSFDVDQVGGGLTKASECALPVEDFSNFISIDATGPPPHPTPSHTIANTRVRVARGQGAGSSAATTPPAIAPSTPSAPTATSSRPTSSRPASSSSTRARTASSPTPATNLSSCRRWRRSTTRTARGSTSSPLTPRRVSSPAAPRRSSHPRSQPTHPSALSGPSSAATCAGRVAVQSGSWETPTRGRGIVLTRGRRRGRKPPTPVASTSCAVLRIRAPSVSGVNLEPCLVRAGGILWSTRSCPTCSTSPTSRATPSPTPPTAAAPPLTTTTPPPARS